MPLFLAGLLVRGGVLDAQLVEEALQRQVLAGGALDSSLLELGALDEPVLSEYLARASGLPLAPADALERIDPRLRRLFPLRLAERHGLVPFDQQERTLHMACAYPADAALLEEMGFLLSQKIEAWVAPEFRVRLAIERLYGQPASVRMHELARACGAEAPPAAPPAAPAPVDPERALAPEWSVTEALERLEAATERDEAIEVALRFGRRHFEFVALFGLVGGRAVGWDAIGAGTHQRIEQVVQPLDEETVLATVMRTRGRYLGPLASTEPNRRLVERLGRTLPQTALVHPVEVGGRAVALLWADNGSAVVEAENAAESMRVAQALGLALERLIRGRKAAIGAETVAAPVVAPAEAAAPVAREEATEAAPADPLPDAPPSPSPEAPPIFQEPAVAGAEGSPAATLVAEAAHEEGAELGRDEPLPLPAGPAPEAEAAPLAPAPAPAAPGEDLAAAGAGGTSGPSPAAVPQVLAPAQGGATDALHHACAGVEALLVAVDDRARAAALARIAGAGALGAEVLVALLPGPVRLDENGAVCGGAILDALAALGPWAVPALTQAAASRSSHVRYWAAVLLAGAAADPAAHAALARLASDRVPEVAAVARSAAQPTA